MSRRIPTSLVYVSLVFGMMACEDHRPQPASRPTVMVIDFGFHEDTAVFRDKIAASYTIECADDTTAGGDGGATPDGSGTDARAALLEELAHSDESCGLRPGVTAKDNLLADLAGERERWNAAMASGQPAGVLGCSGSLDGLYNDIVARLTSMDFHGTSTAGVIARNAPGVSLVLVEMTLMSADEFAASFTCIAQSELDDAVTLFSDPEVRKAYIERPLSRQDRDLRQLRQELRVGIVNESWGESARFALEQLLFDNGCPAVSLRPYFGLMNELDRAFEAAHPEPGVLVVKSAGNDGALTDSGEDSVDCRIGAVGRLTIGASTRNGERAYFTNFGACVDAYAPGMNVLSPVPGDFLFPLHGTSFSAPLVARLLIDRAQDPFDVATERFDLLALRTPSGNLPRHLFPREALYEWECSIARSALTAGATRPNQPAAVPTTFVRKLLWPLRWLGRRRS